MRITPLVVATLLSSLSATGCKKKEKQTPPPTAGSAIGSGSAASGSAAGAGAGSAPAAGSGSAVAAGSGSAATGGGAAPATASVLTQVGFPSGALTGAEAGQHAFAPNSTRLKSAVGGEERDKNKVDFGIVEIVSVGPTETKVKAGSDEWMVPNPLVLPIPKEQTVAAGDLIVASRYGNSLDRAIVVGAGKANFMYTLPAKDAQEGTLTPGQYYKLDGTAFQRGSAVAYPVAKAWQLGTVLSVTGDQLLLATPMGELKAIKTAEAKSLPLAATVKPGDKVTGLWSSFHLKPMTIKKVDAKRGHYITTMDKPFDGQDYYVPFDALTTEVLP